MNDDDKKNPGRIIDFSERKNAHKPVDWKITYQIKKSQTKKKFFNDKTIFWIKFVAYLCLVVYGLKQCGY